MPKLFVILFLILLAPIVNAAQLSGIISSYNGPIPHAHIALKGTTFATYTDSVGQFTLKEVPQGSYTLQASCMGFQTAQLKVNLTDSPLHINISLTERTNQLNDVVVTGAMREVTRMESLIPVEVYNAAFFKKNPTPCLFDALQNINGVRPQLNCNICNTGDIHINGLEGPYTMVLIDGMPIVSSLATVYGLSGIPNSIVERIEIIKGPASTLYGSEAIGGIINVITKKPEKAPQLAISATLNTWQENNLDVSVRHKIGTKITALTGINGFYYQNRQDNNNDHFTDVTLQSRISLFQKWSLARANARPCQLALRYYYEDRFGGEMNWTKAFRGTDSIYGESIYTQRIEGLWQYALPTKENIVFSASLNAHHQDSRYGTTSYIAQQNIAFAQLVWTKSLGHHQWLAGIAHRYTYYTDNTAAFLHNKEQKATALPGIFMQDEYTKGKSTYLLGMRYDYNTLHGNIYTPRIGGKWKMGANASLRANAGTGYRVVNIYTEDHAALTGARAVELQSNLQPEKSYNANLNLLQKISTAGGHQYTLDATCFYTYFTNRIVANYDLDPNKIIYNNLSGHAVSQGVSVNMDAQWHNGLRMSIGATLMDVATINDGIKTTQMQTEHFTATWSASYKWKRMHTTFDYTGNVYSPMRLPLLGPLDPRKAVSPWWSLQNIQATYQANKRLEIYAGVKNLLNFTPARNNPFLIARSQDPFDKQVTFDAQGNALSTPQNPYALTFDPNYVYAPTQTRRLFLGVNYSVW